SQAKVDQRTFWKRRIAFHVAAAQAQIGELAVGNAVLRSRAMGCRCGLEPDLEPSLNGLVQIQEVNSRLTVRVCPGHLHVGVEFKTTVGQLKAEIEQRSGSLRFGCKNIH